MKTLRKHRFRSPTKTRLRDLSNQTKGFRTIKRFHTYFLIFRGFCRLLIQPISLKGFLSLNPSLQGKSGKMYPDFTFFGERSTKTMIVGVALEKGFFGDPSR